MTRLASLLTMGLSLAWPTCTGWVKYKVSWSVNDSIEQVIYKAGQFADNRSFTSQASLYSMGLAPGSANQSMTMYDKSNTRLASLLTTGPLLAWPICITWVQH